MVRGVEIFKERFGKYQGQYAFIGGTACDIILFKMKAWLDLTARKEAGENIDSKDIKKHKNDVLRLAANIDADKVVPISGKIRNDAVDFMERAKDEEDDVKQLGIKGASYVEVMNRIRHCFELGR